MHEVFRSKLNFFQLKSGSKLVSKQFSTFFTQILKLEVASFFCLNQANWLIIACCFLGQKTEVTKWS